MASRSIGLPLFSDPDYKYSFTLERISYRFRFYYNERMETWIMEIRLSDGTPVVMGVPLVPYYPMTIDYADEISGFFWLEPVGENQNETTSNPFELYKYYRLFYVWDDGEPEQA